ncbi:OmpA-OmpF porin, OOP family [Rhodovulum sp. ES.010]|uniref:OmpA family protein n=1 Tax=Rhodovulum sp. ES.010 TaxID=1882821 RepID=UPI000925FC63|nr:OmpA family protein [Rhodovulum sp. ES.010]SIO47037.1 OmpA-OmpF porin, OOP family [Rhodovulum sp. ES.010]
MTHLAYRLLTPAVIALAAGLCLIAALAAVDLLESRTGKAVRTALAEAGIDWATAEADGMLVHLAGTAPDEAARFHALSAAGAVVDAAHVLDGIEVEPPNALSPPEFGVELLRNDGGISVIGLLPEATDRDALARTLSRIAGRKTVTDMLDSASHPAPDGWEAALDFGLEALERLESAKVSIAPGRVAINAISDSAARKARLERDLAAAAPEGLELALDISAPRPMIAPFTLRFLLDDGGARFDACATDSAVATEAILDAARQVGYVGTPDCLLGLGVPDPGWGQAVAEGIAALGRIGGGALTFSDGDVTLVARTGSDRARFDKAVADFEAALPAPFDLHAVLAEPVKVDGSGGEDGPAEFVATLSPEGLVQLRGRVPDALALAAAESYARSRFGRERIHAAMRIDPALPEGWPLRMLAGLEALSQLRNGSVIVQAGFVKLSGLTMDDTAKARIARTLSDRLGDAQDFQLEITYRAPPAVPDNRPSPAQCVARIGEILAKEKITFAPGSTDIEGSAVRVVDRIADVLRGCPGARIEIGGHTDSQGGEEMNASLSQRRAEAVLTALMARRVLTSNLTAKGYGESRPIADNGTEDGREANRRIEFRLIPAEDTDASEQPDQDTATAGDGGEDGQD